MLRLWSSPYVTIERCAERQAVIVARSALSFGDARTAQGELESWERALTPCPEPALLLDFRLTPMTSDPDILREVVTRADALALRFARRALLISAPLLGPQAERIARVGGSLRPVYDEATAWAQLHGR